MRLTVNEDSKKKKFEDKLASGTYLTCDGNAGFYFSYSSALFSALSFSGEISVLSNWFHPMRYVTSGISRLLEGSKKYSPVSVTRLNLEPLIPFYLPLKRVQWIFTDGDTLSNNSFIFPSNSSLYCVTGIFSIRDFTVFSRDFEFRDD